MGKNGIHQKYHDTEWGVPLHRDQNLFEFLLLDGAQAGLSWITILKRRSAYRKSFDNFDPKKITSYKKSNVNAIMKYAGIKFGQGEGLGSFGLIFHKFHD